MKDQLEKIFEGAGRSLTVVIFQHFPGGTE
jgi:hypothetical protein